MIGLGIARGMHRWVQKVVEEMENMMNARKTESVVGMGSGSANGREIVIFKYKI